MTYMVFTFANPSSFHEVFRIIIFLQIGVDRNDLSKVFVQLTLEFLSKQVNSEFIFANSA